MNYYGIESSKAKASSSGRSWNSSGLKELKKQPLSEKGQQKKDYGISAVPRVTDICMLSLLSLSHTRCVPRPLHLCSVRWAQNESSNCRCITINSTANAQGETTQQADYTLGRRALRTLHYKFSNN